MICTDCRNSIKENQTYYRFKNKGTTLCSKYCVHSAYKGFYSIAIINKGIQELNKEVNDG